MKGGSEPPRVDVDAWIPRLLFTYVLLQMDLSYDCRNRLPS